jgi:CRP/FNR family transcriptional regulator
MSLDVGPAAAAWEPEKREAYRNELIRGGGTPTLSGGIRAKNRFPTLFESASCRPLGALWDGHDLSCASLISDKHFSRNETLFDALDDNKTFSVVTSGVVRLHRDLADGRRSILGFAIRGSLLGAPTRGAHACSATAVGSVSTKQMPRIAFLAIAKKSSKIMEALHSSMAAELSLAYDQMLLLGRCKARERVAAFLIAFKNRLDGEGDDKVLVALPMTRGDIGDYLGLTIETVSRIINAFAREGIISLESDSVRICDFRKLEAAMAA